MPIRGSHAKVPRIPIAIDKTHPAEEPCHSNIEAEAAITYGGRCYLVRAVELDSIRSLGTGAYGCVDAMRLKRHPNVIMAVKRVPFAVNEEERKTIEMDVEIIKSFGHHPNIVQFYCALCYEGDIWICMELMDISMDQFYRKAFDINFGMPEPLLRRLIRDVVTALLFLKINKVIHRDVKPSNILLDRSVQFKLCDFGISGRLVDSVAKTFNKGCRPYFAPERIQPTGPYDIRSDVWSLGISIIEMGRGAHPYHGTVFQILSQITSEQVPQLPSGRYSCLMEDFVARCLSRNVDQRPNYSELLQHDLIKSVDPQISNFERRFVRKIIDLHLDETTGNSDMSGYHTLESAQSEGSAFERPRNSLPSAASADCSSSAEGQFYPAGFGSVCNDSVTSEEIYSSGDDISL